MLTRLTARTALAAVALLLAAGAGLWIAPPVFARITLNTIDPVATLADGGRVIVLTGPIRNDQVEWDQLRVTVTQRTTGAVAEGRARVRGTTEEQQWEVVAEAQGRNAFEAGPALAVALAASVRRGVVTDAHQWLVEVELVAE